MTKKERYTFILDYFEKHNPAPETELHYTNGYELVVAVSLSAQCTDKRVNLVTPALFSQFPNPQTLANASFEEVFKLIRSISYPNNKAKHLIGMAKMLVEKFDAKIPQTLEELIQLPGVGRKTANVLLSVLYNQNTMAVDTHVFRVSHKLGLVAKTKTSPKAVELELYKHIPADKIPFAHHWLILHGRYTCLARNPLCATCPFSNFCPSAHRN